MKNIKKTALVNAFVTALYIVVIASIMFYAPKFESSDSPSVLIPISILMLFVFSAAFTGFFVFGRPALWYLDGNKKDALSLLFWTMTIFFIVMLGAFSILLYLK